MNNLRFLLITLISCIAVEAFIAPRAPYAGVHVTSKTQKGSTMLDDDIFDRARKEIATADLPRLTLEKEEAAELFAKHKAEMILGRVAMVSFAIMMTQEFLTGRSEYEQFTSLFGLH